MHTPPSSPALPATPHVLVIVVPTGDPQHILSATRTLRAQTYPVMDVVAVDDTGKEEIQSILRSRLGDDRVLCSPKRLGFARAVNVALRDPMVAHTGMRDADLLLVMKADVALSPDAIAWMVRRMQMADDIGIVGPKIRAWTEAPMVNSFGLSADAFGHREGEGEPGELDQGQYDDREEALWVESTCMMVRTDVYKEIGGFDSRYDHVREDFDLCWRARILGWQVALCPQAVVYAADDRDDPATHRYYETRNTVTTRWKNQSAGRLITTGFLSVFAGLFTLLWLLLTRQFSLAGATVRGWAWALTHLPGTRTRRTAIQRLRRVPESALDTYRVRGIPRLGRVVSSVLELGEGRDQAEADDQWSLTDPLADQPFQRFLRDQSLILIGLPLLITLLFSTAPFWSSTDLSGGQLTPWPSGRSWLDSLIAGLPLAPIGQQGPASPLAWLLASITALLPIPGWLVQRILFFGLPILAWSGTMALGAHLTERLAPRVFSAAVVATSPLLIGAMGEGNVDVAVALAITPALASAALRMTKVGFTAPAWRSTAYWAFLTAILVSTGPLHALWVLIPLMVLMVVRALRPHARMGLVRLSVGLLCAAGLAGPWLRIWLHGGAFLQSLTSPDPPPVDWLAALTGQPGVRLSALLTQVSSQPLELVTILWPVLIPTVAVVAAFTIGLRRNPLSAGLGTLGLVIGGYGLYSPQLLPSALDEARKLLDLTMEGGAAGLWLVGVAVLVVLTVQWSTWEEGTRTRTSWWGMGLSALLFLGIVAQTVHLANAPWHQVHTHPLIPAFVQGEAANVGPQRVIRLGRDRDGRLEWAVMYSAGPSMSTYGQFDDPTWVEAIQEALPSAVRQIGSDAGTTLGALGVRWLVLDGADDGLTSALSAQSWLDRVPSGAGVVYRVATWQPLLTAPEPSLAQGLRTGAGIPAITQAELVADLGLRQTSDGYRLSLAEPHGDLLTLASPASTRWQAIADGQVVEPLPATDTVLDKIHGWTIPTQAREVRIRVLPDSTHWIYLWMQAIVMVILLSLAIRPPGRQLQRQIEEGELPEDLADIADQTGPIPVIRPGQGGL